MYKRSILLLLILFAGLPAQAQFNNSSDAAEIRLELKKLTVLGSVLYIAAHPDDENNAFLTYMSKGLCYRTAYLSCTRGEGGQNLLGPEQGSMLGLIRTQELLAARRIDGAEQYFTRAIDFGFSKSSEETLRFWGTEKTLSDIVWVIRTFRPDVIVTRFTPALGGHGNHTASASLAYTAFRAAADSTRFPEQLRFTAPWQAKRLVWNAFRFSARDTSPGPLHSVTADLGGYDPLLGKSFTEIAGESRSMHKSQGFGSSQYRGEFINYFQHIDGDTAKKDLFDGINTSWSRIKGGEIIQQTLEEANRTFDDNNPAQSIPVLLKAARMLSHLPQEPLVQLKRKELEHVICACAGIRIDAATADDFIVPGGGIKITTTAINRSVHTFILERITLPYGNTDTLVHARLENNIPLQSEFTLRLPDHIAYTQPYWLQENSGTGSYNVSDQTLIGKPENSPPIVVHFILSSSEGTFQDTLELEVPLQQKTVDPVDGETARPVHILPPLTINLQEPVYVFPNDSGKNIVLNLKSAVKEIHGSVRLEVPSGWTLMPASQQIYFQNKNEEQQISFCVYPSETAKCGTFKALADIGNSVMSLGEQTVNYKHIAPQMLFTPAAGRLLKIDIKKKGQSAGYIMGAGDEIPSAIRQMGYTVELLSDKDLQEAALSKYDVIIAGVRAYNTRPKLRLNQKRLLDYVQKGGSYIVQYVTPQRNEADSLGPYPFTVSRDRVTEEDARVTFKNPRGILLTSPNRITEDDFDGWIQERGLYFANTWDARYDSVLACHDQNESPKAGGLLAAQYGKGYFIYCAYAFFRQLPAGVEGAYRLFANILSLQSGRRTSAKGFHKARH